jgi:hypothetical protein
MSTKARLTMCAAYHFFSFALYRHRCRHRCLAEAFSRPLLFSQISRPTTFSRRFPLLLISNSILQAADNDKGFKLALEVDDWHLWANRGSFYEIVRKAFTTGSTSNYHARRDISFFYWLFDSEKVAKKNMKRYGCIFRHR